MHELGVVFHIISQLERVAAEHDVKSIRAVTLRLGEVSGVIPSYLTDCWQWARAKNDLVREAELRVETIPAVTLCRACGEEYSTVEHGRTCPRCGSGETHLLRGNEFLIHEIVAPEPEEEHG